MPFAADTPAQVRLKIRQGQIQGPTAGLCPGYAQANLVVLPQALAYDFLLFAQRNPRACPLLEVSDTGSRLLTDIAPGADIATDLPKYRVYEHGAMVCERTDVSSLWRDDLVSFLIGCSFSFEADLLEAGIPVRHIEEGRNVPMCMRPMSYSDAIRSIQITGAMPRVHGAPVHFGDPAVIGIRDIDRPDFGDAVTIRPGEIPVFWPCGVTPQAALMQSKPAFAITHAPGHMLITDVKNICLKY